MTGTGPDFAPLKNPQVPDFTPIETVPADQPDARWVSASVYTQKHFLIGALTKS